ncbi:membrane protein [Desulforamulus reducens MI-1]|uniref:Membrane protein n=2 Tax=Desulforamulus TaxID=2916693 RepID=A4J9H3_DESRM|nr:membrane protein [Desulforamulus reducens MI-1]
MKDIEGMIRKNYELSKQLTPRNEVIYTDIVCYLRTSSLNELEVEELIQEILEIFLSTQSRGERIEQAIGTDYRSFCDSLIAAASVQPRRNKWHRTLANLEMWINTIIILWLIDLVFEHLPKMIQYKKPLLNYEVNAGFLISALLIVLAAIFTVKYIGKHSFSLSAKKSLRKRVGMISGFAVGTLFALLFVVSKELGSFVLFSAKLYQIAAGFVAMIIMIKGIQTINNIRS